jgi:hypothetical protein
MSIATAARIANIMDRQARGRGIRGPVLPFPAPEEISGVIDVIPGPVANFTVRRSDGVVLSLSSMGKSLIEWSEDGQTTKDHGWVGDAEKYLQILAGFLGYSAVKGPGVFVVHKLLSPKPEEIDAALEAARMHVQDNA